MISKQLLQYIEKEDKLGKSKKEIEKILSSADWHKDAISEALDIYYKKGKTEEAKKELIDEPEDVKKIEISVKPESEGATSETKESVEQEEEKVEPIIETKREDTKSEKRAESKKEKKRVRPVFLAILGFVLGVAIMMVVSIFFLNNQAKDTSSAVKNVGGFEAQKIDDGKRIAEVLGIQKSLEKYYTEHKSYSENVNSLTSIPTVSSELNYTYTPIGSPPQRYTLNIEMKNTEDDAFKIDGGFMTLKNKQGTK